MNIDKPLGITFVVIGTLGFWGIVVYRLFSEGFSWLVTTSGGIIICGFIGIIGVICITFDGLRELHKESQKRLDIIEDKIIRSHDVLLGQILRTNEQIERQFDDLQSRQ